MDSAEDPASARLSPHLHYAQAGVKDEQPRTGAFGAWCMQRIDDNWPQVEAGMSGGYALTAFLALGGVWTDDDEDSPGTLGRAADVGDVGRPGSPARARLRGRGAAGLAPAAPRGRR